MAIQQVLTVYLNLKGDGAASTFSFALQNLYQFANGIAVPFGGEGMVPTAVAVNNPPVPVTSATVDANGNITLTLTSPLGSGIVATFQLDLTFNSGASSSSSATQTTNVSLVGSSAVQLLDSGGTNKASISAGGAVKVDGSAATQPVSGTVTANAGTGNFTVVQSTAASLNATVVGTGTFAVQAAQSGTWNIGTLTTVTNPVTVVGDSASGASKAGNPVQIGGVFNTTQPTVTTGQTVEAQSTARGAQIVATGVDTFNVTVNAALPAGSNVIGHVITDTGSTTAVTGTVTVSGTVTANIGTTNGLALDASVTGLQVSQGSTTSGQKGGLILGAVTTSAPTYTTAQTSPLSLDTSGNLRVAGSFSSGALADLVGTPGTLNAGNATATINAFGYTSVGMFLAAGTLIGTIVPEASLDGGTTWVSTFFSDPITGILIPSFIFTASNTATTASILGVAGASNYRVRVSAFTSGTASCTLRANEISDVLANAATSNTSAAAWTSATAQNTAVTLINGTFSYDILIVTLNQTTTLTAGAVTFEVSNDNTNWFARTGLDPTNYGSDISTYALTASTYKVLKFAVSGFQYFRVRLSTAITGTATVTIGYAAKAGGQSQIQVQQEKDSGRTQINYYATGVASGTTTTETAFTLTRSAGTAATTTGTSFVITAGKVFRITSITFATRGNATATAQVTTFSFRINTGGAVTTSSTPILAGVRSATPATALAWDRFQLPIPDGFEIAGTGTLQFGITANAVFTTNAPTWDVFISGFEY